jgi:phosphoribosyl-ATP pyrophosphohydrolase/phosphoribosyl-AMP cyclohydrolase
MTDGEEGAPDVDFAKGGGLVPCIAQDAVTGRVLMLAYVSEESLQRTRETGFMHYFSRSRNRVWKKGEESGHVQEVVSIDVDCDGDALLAKVRQTGPACHTGEPCCFYTPVMGDGDLVLHELWAVLLDRKAHPKEGSHTTKLLANENLRLKKVAEEAAELIMAAHKHDRAGVVYEAADLVYHTLAVLAAEGVEPRAVLEELARRRAPSKPSKAP